VDYDSDVEMVGALLWYFLHKTRWPLTQRINKEFLIKWGCFLQLTMLQEKTSCMTNVISQHVGQLRGRIEGFCVLHLKLRDFFALLLLKPKSDRISLQEGNGELSEC
jgi:hypothetical protein